jgi:hypothetical protein
VVFAIDGEDGGPIAHTAVIVRPDAGGGASASGASASGASTGSASTDGAYYLTDTHAIVSVPGLSDTRLAGTYAFAGAAGVAATHDGGELRPSTGWVDVPPAVWATLLHGGVEITLVNDFDVFDGTTFYEFAAGTRRVGGEELRALANGIEYLPLDQRRAIRATMAKASLAELAAADDPPEGVLTNLTARGWGRLTEALRGAVEASATP